ncbi:hypothetical protein RN001_003496 [Aquatica leii]|uniref:Uncharacterized protein n=1 Tax=Aquatica leii TaxID=1421715 RepID=A0AAN7QBR1_9COLE|nr:hypothetical protein RN001_003496 [Aquatica leii]
MFQTRGGSAEVTTYTSWEEKLLRLISLNVKGLGSENNSDQIQATAFIEPETDIHVINNLCNKEVMEVVMLETEAPVPTTSFIQTDVQVETAQSEVIKWDSWTPAKLKAPQSEKLKTRQGSEIPNKYSSIAELISIQKK